jgi:predicted transcriptional regulator
MRKKSLPPPTEAELALLRALWKLGPSTVRQLYEAVSPAGDRRYTTVLKTLQIMTEKGLVRRDDSQRSHLYAAAQPEEATQRQLVGNLLDRVFGGSAQNLVMHALTAKRASATDLAAIRKLLDELEGKP